MTPTIEDIHRSFSVTAFERARRYQREGRVWVREVADNGARIDGEVQGSARAPYLVSARARRLDNGRWSIGGECSCPMRVDCKHVAALLLHVAAGGQGGIRRAVASRDRVPELSPEVAAWLARVEREAQDVGEDYPTDVRRRLIYILSMPPDWQGVPGPVLTAISVRVLQSGEFSGKMTAVEPQGVIGSPSPPRYLRPSDHTLLRHLAKLPARGSEDGRALSGESAEILAMALATGRCHWLSITGVLLSLGEPRVGLIRWALTADGRQRPKLVTDGDAIALPMAPPWYADPVTGLCGPLEIALEPRLTALLLAAPPIAAGEIDAVRRRLATGLAEPGAFQPPALLPPRRIDRAPVPRLILLRQESPPPTGAIRPRGASSPGDRPLARLAFRYEDIVIPAHDPRAVSVIVGGDRMIEVVRHRPAERQARLLIDTLGLRPLGTDFGSPHPASAHFGDLTFAGGGTGAEHDQEWVDFLVDDLPGLVARGWEVETADDFPLRLAQPESDPEAVLSEGSGIDWFDLHLGVAVDGQRVDILPALLRLLRDVPTEGLADFLDNDDKDQTRLRLRLEDGRILPLTFARLRPILRALAGLYAAAQGDGPIRFTAVDAAELAGFAEVTAAAGLVWRGGEQLRALGRRLKDAAGIPPVSVPDLFVGTLRSYQQMGVAWMQLLREVGLGGVLADDMGLGKTVQALAHLAIEKSSGRADRPSLIVAPTSVLPNWQAELDAFTPALQVLVLHGAARSAGFGRIATADIVLTTYPLLARDGDVLAAQAWHLVIIDEAQNVKNPATTAAQSLRRLDARHRLALTGTPLENHLGELWALFDFVSPGFLGDARGFAKSWRLPIEKQGDRHREAALARRVRPFLLRRTKLAVAADLPDKTEITEHIALSPVQRDLYEAIRLSMHKKIREAIAAKGLNRSHILLLDALLKLRQACCDPRLVKAFGSRPQLATRADSAKLTRLMEMLPELIDEGRRILLFSQFTSMLALIETELLAAKLPFLLLTGDTKDRRAPVEAFQSGRAPLFLISLKAGGTGLNLTAADTVIHYDPWWNPAVEAQATDRAHRIGQDKPVFVHKLLALDSIEGKMAELKARKQALADGLFGGEGGKALDIGVDDIEFLLGN